MYGERANQEEFKQRLLQRESKHQYTFDCLFVALRKLHEMRMSHIVICDLPVSTVSIISHYFTKGNGKKVIIGHKIYFDFIYNFCLKRFSL
jgi:hypothetical protein